MGALEGTRARTLYTFTSNTFPQVAVMAPYVSGTLCNIMGHTTSEAPPVSFSEWVGGGRVARSTALGSTANSSLSCSSLVAFHPDPTRLLLFSSAVDTSIRVWSLQDRLCLAVLTSHYSAVTSLSFSEDGHTMLRSAAGHTGLRWKGRDLELRDLFLLSSGRDKICIVWDLQRYQAKRTVPVFEVWPDKPGPAKGAGMGVLAV